MDERDELREQAYARARAAMLAEIEAEVRDTASWLGIAALDPRVAAAVGRVPRHAFVPESYRDQAYGNYPLPIGHGQTISQPYMVAVMSALAAIGPGDRVLEIGTGCGYQSAILAELAARVVSVEVVPALAERAAARLAALGYGNVEVHRGDGARGWPAGAPYDAVVVTAAAEGRAPPALLEQLVPGGRLVIPIDYGVRRGFGLGFFGRDRDQQLVVIVKPDNGAPEERRVLPVAFVPLVEGG